MNSFTPITADFRKIGCFPFGIPGQINSVKNTDKQFYLVEKDGKQFFVTVTDEFIEICQLAKRVDGKKSKSGIGNLQNAHLK
ncbi:hypothetical protein [Eubacterium sp.]|uniref:hypothetical protein n=1 Tax=Eubacterium sp. TaxID=142586 RepID=UPI003F0B9812